MRVDRNMSGEETEQTSLHQVDVAEWAELKRMEQAQRFRVDLSDALRDLTDAPTMANMACRMLCEFLGVSRANWALAYPEEERLEVQAGWKNGQPGPAGVYSYKDFGLGLLQKLSNGEKVLVADVAKDPLTKEFYETSYAPLGIGAFMAESLVRSQNLLAIMSVHNTTPRRWTVAESELLEDVARRVWDAVERSRAEANVRRMTERYRALAETTASIVFLATPEGRFTELPLLRGIWLEGGREWAADAWLQMIHDDDRISTTTAWRRAIETQCPFEANFRLRTISGAYRWHWARAVQILDDIDASREWVGSCIDIHERVEQDRTLKVLNDFTTQAQLLDTPAAVIECAHELLRERLGASKVIYSEPNLDEESLEHEPQDQVGDRDCDHPGEPMWSRLPQKDTHSEFEDSTDSGHNRAASLEEPPIMEAMIQLPLVGDKKVLATLEVHYPAPRAWSSDEVSIARALLKRCWSETQRARAQRKLRLADKELRNLNAELDLRVRQRTNDLEMANEELASFTYTVSHDLRAPLRSIVATSQIILAESDQIGPEHRAMLERQVHNSINLANLIDQLLKLSRLARQKLVKKRIDLSQMGREISEEILGQESKPTCTFEIEENLSTIGDENLIRMALWNLLENACKFSPNGGTVRMGRKVVENEVVFFIQDQGVGFDMSYIGKLFKPFERLVLESEFPGSGIGLSSVKKIVQRHGGRIWAESAVGTGSTFYFTLGRT